MTSVSFFSLSHVKVEQQGRCILNMGVGVQQWKSINTNEGTHKCAQQEPEEIEMEEL